MGENGNYDFLTMVGKDIDRIKNCFRKGLLKFNASFDEDVFSDTMLKCYDKLQNTKITNDVAMRYFWISFKNNTLKTYDRYRNRYTIVSNVSGDTIDEPYDNRCDVLFEIISDYVAMEYGADVAWLWKKHVLEGATYEDLQKETNVENLHYRFRKIRDYVRTELPKINDEFREIINELF